MNNNDLFELASKLNIFLIEEHSNSRYSNYFKEKLEGLLLPDDELKNYFEINNEIMIECLNQCITAIVSDGLINNYTLLVIYSIYKGEKIDDLIKNAKLIKRCIEVIGSQTKNQELLNRGIILNYALNHFYD